MALHPEGYLRAPKLVVSGGLFQLASDAVSVVSEKSVAVPKVKTDEATKLPLPPYKME